MANPFDEKILGAEQQRQYAQRLRESAQPTQGQMVSGYYVPPAATQNLSELAKALTGAFMENRANQNIQDIQAQKQKAIADALKGYQATQGTKTELTSDLTNMSPAAQQFAQPTQQVQYTPQEQDADFVNLYQLDPQAAQAVQMAMALRQGRQSEADKQAAAAEARRQFEENKALQRQQMQQQMQIAQGGWQNARDLESQKLIGATTNEKPLTEFQGKAMGYGTRAQQANEILNKLGTNYSPLAMNAASSVDWIPGIGALANKALGENEQQAGQAQRNFINAVLRQESGATISDSEFANAKKQYFPQPGDSPAVLAQKAANREQAIKSFKIESGPAAKYFDQTPQFTSQPGVIDFGSLK